MAKELTLTKDVAPFVQKAQELTISTPADMEIAVSGLSMLNKQADRIEEEKNKVMRPLLDAVAAERKRWAPFEKPLADAVAIVRRKITDYQTTARKAEQEEKDKIAARVGDGKGYLKAETAIAKIEAVAAPEAKVNTDHGSVRFTTIQKFEVVDLTLLPLEYHLADEVAIRKAMKAGQEIPGVRYFTEEVPVNLR